MENKGLGSGLPSSLAYEAYLADTTHVGMASTIKHFFRNLFNISTERFSRGVTFDVSPGPEIGPLVTDKHFLAYESVWVRLPPRESETMYQLWNHNGIVGPIATGRIGASQEPTFHRIGEATGIAATAPLMLTLYAPRLGEMVLYTNTVKARFMRMLLNPLDDCGAVSRGEEIELKDPESERPGLVDTPDSWDVKE